MTRLAHSRSGVEVGVRTLVTACHVVDGATTVKVTHDQGKTSFPVSQVTRDPGGEEHACLDRNQSPLGDPCEQESRGADESRPDDREQREREPSDGAHLE